jgi:hypothetical protein
MKKISQAVDDLLLDYLDGNLSAADNKKIETSLQENPSWRARLEELRLINSILADPIVESPSKNFTAYVMDRLDQYQAPSRFSSWNSVLLLVGVLIAVGITTVLLAGGIYDHSSTNVDLNQIDFSDNLIKTPLPSLEFNGKLIVNIIIVMNLAIAWVVLDRAILKPFFRRRMQAGH